MNTAADKLSTKKIRDLVMFITEDFGSDMNYSDFSMALLNMLEDVAGMENLSGDTQAALINTAFNIYNPSTPSE